MKDLRVHLALPSDRDPGKGYKQGEDTITILPLKGPFKRSRGQPCAEGTGGRWSEGLGAYCPKGLGVC